MSNVNNINFDEMKASIHRDLNESPLCDCFECPICYVLVFHKDEVKHADRRMENLNVFKKLSDLRLEISTKILSGIVSNCTQYHLEKHSDLAVDYADALMMNIMCNYLQLVNAPDPN